jgi:type IV secretory pathway VirB2 component (pilin)
MSSNHKYSVNKKLVMLGLLSVLFVSAIFAQSSGDVFGLGKYVKILVDLVSSPWVKGIAVVALVIECITMITAGRQEPGMFKKFVPWIAGTVIFMAAGTITNTFLNMDDNTVKELSDSLE